jgi:hypothetical protein
MRADGKVYNDALGADAMPLHDWTRVPAGLFHDFHQSWSIRIKDALNAGLLPSGTVALVEQRAKPGEPDVLAIEGRSLSRDSRSTPSGGTLVREPPTTTFMQRTDRAAYALKANRIVIRHHFGPIIAVIEILSPGNKDSRGALNRFVEKTAEFIQNGVHVLVVDSFPPTLRDPSGIHKVIWDEIAQEQPFALPAGKDRVFVSYESSYDWRAYVEAIAVGDLLPAMPLFLSRSHTESIHIKTPLEETYQATWKSLPQEVQRAVETGVLPDGDAQV